MRSALKDVLNSRRTVLIHYREVPLQIAVTSVREEIDLRMAATLKSAAVGQGLTPLTFESGFGAPLATKVRVEASLLRGMESARLACNDKLSGEVQSGEVLREAVTAKYDLYSRMDTTWAIDSAFCSACTGDFGVQVVSDAVLRAFPSDIIRKNFQETTQDLRKLQNETFFKFSSRVAQAICAWARPPHGMQLARLHMGTWGRGKSNDLRIVRVGGNGGGGTGGYPGKIRQPTWASHMGSPPCVNMVGCPCVLLV